MINFQPIEAKPAFELPKPGYYYGVVIAAEMRTPRSGGNAYLSITFELQDEKLNKHGRLYDNIFQTDKPFNAYRLQRLGQAFNLVGKTMALSDLPKVIVGKTIIFRVKIEKSDGYPDKPVVDIADEGIYYAATEASNFFEVKQSSVTDTDINDSAPFDVDDEF